MTDPAVKDCTLCGHAKPLDEFYLTRGRPMARCKGCVRADARVRSRSRRSANPNRDRTSSRAATQVWRAANRERVLELNLLWRYGLSADRYDELLSAQGGTCGVCREPETRLHWKSGEVLNLSVDHDHACCPGKRSCGRCVRGLLCAGCNNRVELFDRGVLSGEAPDRGAIEAYVQKAPANLGPAC